MQITGDGVVVDPEVHDGQLMSIAMSQDKTLTVCFQTASGSSVTLQFLDVVRLRADNFREGNIVFEVRTYTGGECPPDLVARAFDYGEAETARWLPAQLHTIVSEAWRLVVIDSSFGCDLVALGRGALEIGLCD